MSTANLGLLVHQTWARRCLQNPIFQQSAFLTLLAGRAEPLTLTGPDFLISSP